MRTAPSAHVAIGTRTRDALGVRTGLLARCERALDARATAVCGSVPGRIELLGKHVDYAGGRSIVCAIERGIVFAAKPRDDDAVRAIDAVSGESRTFALGSDSATAPGDWAAYPAAVTRRVARDTPRVRRGVDVAFASDLPPAGGLSSSSALVIAVFLAVAHVNDWFDGSPSIARLGGSSPAILADYLAAVESGRPFADSVGDEGVGTLGGSQDHTAILGCRRGMLSRFAYQPTRHLGDHPLPDELTLAVAFSGVAAAKTGDARERYNRASRAAAAIVRLWNERAGAGDPARSLGDVVRSAPNDLADVRRILQAPRDGEFGINDLLQRLEHFAAESGEIHEEATGALAAQDWSRFGDAVARSQRGAEALLANQVAETIELVRLARVHGSLAASAFGAGYGGSVWALVTLAEAPAFVRRWRDSYAMRFPNAARDATFFTSRPCDAAHYLA